MQNVFGKFLKCTHVERCPYQWKLDPYGKGCAGGCKYCFSRTILESWGNWKPETPSCAKMSQIRYQLRNKFKAGDVIRMGGMSDPLQPIDEERQLTAMTVEECVRLGLHHVITTKYARVASDEMMQYYDKRLSHFQITLTTTDEGLGKEIEPGASLVSERIAAIERLQAEGYDVSIRLSPLIVDFVDNGMLNIASLNAIRCNKIQIEFLRINGRIKHTFAGYTDMSRYTFKDGAYWHLPLSEKQRYAEILLKDKPQQRQVSFAERVLAHDPYWRYTCNHNPKDCCNLRR